MEGGQYRLEPVRGVRERAERGARGELAGAVGNARVTEADVARAVHRTTEARAAVTAARQAMLAMLMRGDAAVPALINAERHAARRRRELVDAAAEEARARERHAGRLDAVDATRAQLHAAWAAKEVIERHFARWREQQKRLAERRGDDDPLQPAGHPRV